MKFLRDIEPPVVMLGTILLILIGFATLGVIVFQLRQDLETATEGNRGQSTIAAGVVTALSILPEIARAETEAATSGPPGSERAGTPEALATAYQEALDAIQTQIAPTRTPRPDCTDFGDIPPVPNAPPPGCVLIVEWWVPPNPTACGLLITLQEPSIPTGTRGDWWYVYPSRPDQHIREFRARGLTWCSIDDER